MIGGAFRLITPFFKPSFYEAQYNQVVTRFNKHIVAGSSLPLFTGMLIIGVYGYVIEYVNVGSKLFKICFMIIIYNYFFL